MNQYKHAFMNSLLHIRVDRKTRYIGTVKCVFNRNLFTICFYGEGVIHVALYPRPVSAYLTALYF